MEKHVEIFVRVVPSGVAPVFFRFAGVELRNSMSAAARLITQQFRFVIKNKLHAFLLYKTQNLTTVYENMSSYEANSRAEAARGRRQPFLQKKRSHLYGSSRLMSKPPATVLPLIARSGTPRNSSLSGPVFLPGPPERRKPASEKTGVCKTADSRSGLLLLRLLYSPLLCGNMEPNRNLQQPQVACL